MAHDKRGCEEVAHTPHPTTSISKAYEGISKAYGLIEIQSQEIKLAKRLRICQAESVKNNKSIGLTPAYGRDYKSAEEVRSAFFERRDFVIADVSCRWNGSYANINDLKDYDSVSIRYDKLRRVTIIYLNSREESVYVITCKNRGKLLGIERFEVEPLPGQNVEKCSYDKACAEYGKETVELALNEGE